MADSTYTGAPDRLDRAVAALAGVSRAAARRLIAAGAVFLNRQRCKVASRTVRSGDRLRIAAGASDLTAVAPALSILHEADGLLAIDKPAGMPSAPTQQGASGTALTVLEAQLAARGGAAVRLWVVHRLDAATSGVLLFATSRAAAAELSAAFREQRVHKRYAALVISPPADAGQIDLALAAHRGRTVVDVAGKSARTLWRVVERRDALALLEVEPRSGRMHQIRTHLAAIGHPIVGDRLYGGAPAPRLMLHAASLAVPTAAGEVAIDSPLPF